VIPPFLRVLKPFKWWGFRTVLTAEVNGRFLVSLRKNSGADKQRSFSRVIHIKAKARLNISERTPPLGE
jgi:hypothetical protein